MKGDRDYSEIGLERSGDINILQRYRLAQYWREIERGNTRPPFISHKLLFIEEDLREVVQEEIYINKGAVLNKDAKERLNALNAKYWLLQQKWWHYRSCLADGFQLRAFELWRSYPKWYMHRVLVEDCAGRQGCCARGCDCCLNREINPAPPIPLRPPGTEDETLTAELFRLADEKGRPWMIATARDVLWIVVCFLVVIKTINLLFGWANGEIFRWRRLNAQRELNAQR
ncbi:uncharacterized protein N7479_009714 [Penicillium vulpinum]|uniref:uncharacterized protein n=1 Tax=Penicillium vulpinum TaxID=29845 RepID=UPI002547A47E|nr:uncharacterized protein N7479_009714 [Penicillium vulpinum]KAJ5951301.1 hypothetical protein N7479_009714 [Penicillium vulpinum]